MVWGIALGIALGVALGVALGGALSKRHGDALFGARMMRARNESRPALGLSYGEMIPLGRRIALHCSSHNNLLNMHPNDGCHVSRSDGRNYNEVPIPNTGDWRYTLFYVQDAGNGKIRLFNPYHGKYVAAPTSSQSDSPLRCTTSASSQYAQWQVQDAGGGKISLYNTARGKYLGVGRTSASMASGKGSDEKLRVVPAPDSAQINEDKTASVAVGCSDVTLCDVKDYIVSLGNEISGVLPQLGGQSRRPKRERHLQQCDRCVEHSQQCGRLNMEVVDRSSTFGTRSSYVSGNLCRTPRCLELRRFGVSVHVSRIQESV